MKKILKTFVFCAVIICIVIVGYFAGVKLSEDDIVFELSYSNEGSSGKYYALKEDNTLIWTYGHGRMDNFTYSAFFSYLNEQGFVKVSDEDAKDIKKSMKKALKNYKPVPSNASIHVKDGSEIILKYKNKYYSLLCLGHLRCYFCLFYRCKNITGRYNF